MSIWQEENSLAKAFWENGIVEDCPIYDMHGHMGSHNGIYFKRCEAPDMVAHMRRIGVRRLVFSHHHALGEPSFRNEKMRDICAEYPDILRMYAGINPHYPENIREDLAKFDSWRPYAVGLKFLADYHAVPVSDPKCEYALSFANERKLPVLFHTWGGSPFDGYTEMRKVADKYPDIIMFVGHSLHGDWDNAAKLVKEAPGKVYLELTALPGLYQILEKLTGSVGSERLLYGTDLPWFDEYQVVSGVLSARISDDDKRNILYRNVENLLGKDW